jgi:hypothetical protein
VLLLGENDRGVHEKLKKERSQGEEIMIGVHFVRIWLETSVSVKFIQYVHGGWTILKVSSTQKPISAVELLFMFIAVFLHELAHSSVVWYYKARSHHTGSPKINSISLSEAGNYMEKALFGAISYCEISTKDECIKEVGLEKEGIFYPIGES